MVHSKSRLQELERPSGQRSNQRIAQGPRRKQFQYWNLEIYGQQTSNSNFPSLKIEFPFEKLELLTLFWETKKKQPKKSVKSPPNKKNTKKKN